MTFFLVSRESIWRRHMHGNLQIVGVQSIRLPPSIGPAWASRGPGAAARARFKNAELTFCMTKNPAEFMGLLFHNVMRLHVCPEMAWQECAAAEGKLM